jgi:hypothetical protein
MATQKSNIRKGFQLSGFFIPFTWYCFLFLAAGWIGYHWLQSKPKTPDSAYNDIFPLLIKVAIWFCAAIFMIAFLSAFISFLFFLWNKRKKKIEFNIETKTGEEASNQTIQLHLHPVIKPFLGFIKIRLQYDEEHFSDKFSLVEKSSKKLISTAIDGVYNWPLPEIKEYRIENAVIYFEDFFQFFSFAAMLKTSNSFYTQPTDKPEKEIKISPRKTEETNTRIDELKKVEGEIINYKNFESNDDVRRIVWKIYAKNKELVVRIPEILDPYASHIYLYASFFSAFNIDENETVEIPFLNFYKTMIWSVYNQLVKQGFEVRFVADQNIAQNNFTDANQIVKYAISTSKWQQEKELKNYVKTKDAAMVVVSSLSDIAQVQELIGSYGNDIVFVFVELSKSLRAQHFGDWLQWIFVQQEKDDIAMYKTNWSLSLLRPKILRNEKELKKILEKYERPVLV